MSLVVLLVASGAGVAAPISMAPQTAPTADLTDRSSSADSATPLVTDGGADARQTGGPIDRQMGGQVNQSAVDVTALEAVQFVQNQTDGTVVGVRLVPRNETPAYNVTVLHENRSVSQLTVDATDPSVVGADRNITVVRAQFLGGEAFDYDELRSAADAIRLIQDETNGTVVQLGLRRGQLVYGVALRTPGETRTRALVAATESPVLGLQTTNVTRPPNATGTTTAGR